MAIASLTVDLDASTIRFQQSMDNAAKKLDVIEKGAKKTQSAMEGLKGAFGEDSAFGKSVKLLAGAGAIGGIGFLANEMDRALAKAVEMRNEFNAGAVSAGRVAIEVAKSIPLLGHVISMGDSIHELITGDEAALKKVNAEAAAIEARINRMNDTFALGKRGVKELEAVMKQLREETFKTFAPSSLKGQIAAMDLVKKQFDAINNSRNAAIARIAAPEGGTSSTDLKKQIAAAQAVLNRTIVPKADIRKDVTVSDAGKVFENIVVLNQAQIDEAKKRITDATKVITDARRELQERADSIRPINVKYFANLKEQIGADLAGAKSVGLHLLDDFGAALKAKAAALAMDRAEALAKSQAKMMDAGSRVTESVMSDAERSLQRMDELNKMVTAGAITWQTWGRAAAQAMQDANGGKDNAPAAADAKMSMPKNSNPGRIFRYTEGFPDPKGLLAGVSNTKPVESNTSAIKRLTEVLVRQIQQAGNKGANAGGNFVISDIGL